MYRVSLTPEEQRELQLASSVEELKFDLQGQRCLIYGSIKHLNQLLTAELTGLKEKGI